MNNTRLLKLACGKSYMPQRLLIAGPEGCGKTHAARTIANKFGVSLQVVSLSEWLYLDHERLVDTLEDLAADADQRVLIEHMQGLTLPIIDPKSSWKTSFNAAYILGWLRRTPRWVVEIQTGMAGELCILRQLATDELRLSSPRDEDFLPLLEDKLPAEQTKRIVMAATQAGISLRSLAFAIRMATTSKGRLDPDVLLQLITKRVFT